MSDAGYVVLSVSEAKELLAGSLAVSAAIQNQLSAIHRSEVDGISDDMLPYVEAFRTQAAELVAGQSAKVSLNQLSHLSARICNDLRKSVRTRDASVALIARNPEILSASYSTAKKAAASPRAWSKPSMNLLKRLYG